MVKILTAFYALHKTRNTFTSPHFTSPHFTVLYFAWLLYFSFFSVFFIFADYIYLFCLYFMLIALVIHFARCLCVFAVVVFPLSFSPTHTHTQTLFHWFVLDTFHAPQTANEAINQSIN